MKYWFYSLLLCLFVVASCHRKTVPSATTETTRTTKTKTKPAKPVNTTKNTKKKSEPVKPLLDAEEANGNVAVEEPSGPPVITDRPVIIVDARGNFAVTDTTLPAGADTTILEPKNARGYTPAQTKNLAFRFGKVPPRILYVPEALEKKSARGTYYVLDKKFWYWKKSNGYFYIDDNYFK